MFKKTIIVILLLTVISAVVSVIGYRVFASDDDAVTAINPLNAQQNTVSNQTSYPQVSDQEAIEQNPWQAEGEILEIDANGLSMRTADGEEFYVELGPSDYWQSQDVALQPGMIVRIEGTENDGMIRAYSVTETTGETMQLRTEDGQPLWSGGVVNGRSRNANQTEGGQNPEPQTKVDEWVKINGVLMSYQGGNMSISTDDGALINVQTGQPRFFASQGVTFAIGDELALVGYYNGEQFVAGDITQVLTGLRVMLRDPNGRPLWAGPGNGNGKGGNNQ